VSLPRLDAPTVRAYLARLGGAEVSPDLEGLKRLHRAHLLALPAHNLFQLAVEGTVRRPLRLESAVEDLLVGPGGSREVLTPAFILLLRGLGFDAWLCQADSGAPANHWVGIVRLPEGQFAVDVGQSPALPNPMCLAPEPRDVVFHGCSFRFERMGTMRYRLLQSGPEGTVRTGYEFTPEPCAWRALDAGPGTHDTLQAARGSDWAWVSIHDTVYWRVAGGLETQRPIESWDSLAELLHRTIGLSQELIARALFGLRRRRPDLFGTAGRVVRPPLQFILSLAVTERTEGVDALLHSALQAFAGEGRPLDSLGVLLLDNGRELEPRAGLEAVVERFRSQGLRVTRVEARREIERLAASRQGGLLPAEQLPPPLPIGASRTLQVSLLHEHLRTGRLPLPHPGDGRGPVVVWMLDDDLTFQRLIETSEGFAVRPARALFARVESLWRRHPEASVLLGSFTGEPPIPGYATLHVQTRDLAGNLQAMAGLVPEAPWTPGPAPRELADYYYDHARGSTAHLQVVFPWVPPGRGPWSVRDAFRTLCEAALEIAHGQQVTRPLTHVPSEALVPGFNRGGNALFLDLDALVLAPYPVWKDEDGIMTRRADTLWAHLFAQEPLSWLVRADLDLRHGRWRGDGSSPLTQSRPDLAALQRFVEGQERGVVLARLLEHGAPLDATRAREEISVRRALLERARRGVHEALSEARRGLLCERAWWWSAAERESASGCLAALTRLEERAEAVRALEDPSLPERLSAFARHLLAHLPAWRRTWG
jgi:arylamine N-acetyltransferase